MNLKTPREKLQRQEKPKVFITKCTQIYKYL